MARPATAEPEELGPSQAPPQRERALALLRRRDFRRTFLAVLVSEAGNAFHYIALMWVALVTAGPGGVLAVRLADSIPALLFGLHGGLVADRLDRRRTMVAADLARAATLVPVAVAGLGGHLPIWGLVLAAFALESATSYFAPAYGAIVPALVDRRNVLAANGLVRAGAEAVTVVGWACSAALLTFMPISAFFALNAGSFLVSALLLGGIRAGRTRPEHAEPPRVREGFAALRPRRELATAVVVLGVAVTISSGAWIVGVPELVRTTLGRGAGSFSLVAAGYAAGAITAAALLARIHVRRKALSSFASWAFYLPGYGIFALTRSLSPAVAGGACDGFGQGSALVLVNSAAQEEVPDRVLGRVLGLVSLVHRGAHATGLLLVSPLFLFASARTVFGAAAVAIPLVGLAGVAVALRGGARAPATRRSRRS
jgi:MFS transporter, DHA3 family, macrolide efflux protein